jgi:hypothetical protein
VIGDEPANTNNDRRRRRLLCRRAKESYSPCRSRVRLVCLRVPCGEASRKGWRAEYGAEVGPARRPSWDLQREALSQGEIDGGIYISGQVHAGRYLVISIAYPPALRASRTALAEVRLRTAIKGPTKAAHVEGAPQLRRETAVISCAGANGLANRMLLGTPCEAH